MMQWRGRRRTVTPKVTKALSHMKYIQLKKVWKYSKSEVLTCLCHSSHLVGTVLQDHVDQVRMGNVVSWNISCDHKAAVRTSRTPRSGPPFPPLLQQLQHEHATGAWTLFPAYLDVNSDHCVQSCVSQRSGYIRHRPIRIGQRSYPRSWDAELRLWCIRLWSICCHLRLWQICCRLRLCRRRRRSEYGVAFTGPACCRWSRRRESSASLHAAAAAAVRAAAGSFSDDVISPKARALTA